MTKQVNQPQSVHMDLFEAKKKFIPTTPQEKAMYEFLLKQGQNIVTGVQPLPRKQRKAPVISFVVDGYSILFFCRENKGDKYIVKPAIFVDTDEHYGTHMIKVYCLHTVGMSKYVQHGQLFSPLVEELGGTIYQAVENKW